MTLSIIAQQLDAMDKTFPIVITEISISEMWRIIRDSFLLHAET